MGDEHDSWLSGIGVSVGGVMDKIKDTVSSGVTAVENAVSGSPTPAPAAPAAPPPAPGGSPGSPPSPAAAPAAPGAGAAPPKDGGGDGKGAGEPKGVGVSISGEFTFAEKELGKADLGKYAEVSAKVGGSVKISFSKAEADDKKLSKEEAEAGAKDIVTQLWAKAKWDVGGGPKYNNKDKSVSIAASATLSTEFGPLKGEFTPIEFSVVNWDKKSGLSGPKVGFLNFTGSLAGKRPIKGVDVEIAITASISGELKPEYSAIGQWLLEQLAIDTAEGAIAVDAAAITSAAATIALPLAAAAAIGYGMYQEAKNMKADAEAIQTALAARKQATQVADGYASTITGGRSAGDAGSKAAEDQIAKIMADTHGTREQVTEAVSKAQGGRKAIRDKELQKLKDKMYADAVQIFDDSHKADFGFLENRGETWGFRGTFRSRLKMILYADD